MRVLLYLCLIFTFISCDFSPVIHKDILKAQEYFNDQNYEMAYNKYKTILYKIHSKELKIKITYQIAEILYLHLHNYKEAVSYYKKIYKYTDNPIWLVRAEEKISELNFSIIRNYNEAIKSYLLLLNFKPKLQKYDFYQYRLVQAFIKNKKLENAIKNIEIILKNTDHQYYLKANYLLGQIFYQQKKWMSAVDQWLKYLKIETKKEMIVKVKFFIGNAYESAEKLKKAYNYYYAILGEYPNTKVIEEKLDSIYKRKVARKR